MGLDPTEIPSSGQRSPSAPAPTQQKPGWRLTFKRYSVHHQTHGRHPVIMRETTSIHRHPVLPTVPDGCLRIRSPRVRGVRRILCGGDGAICASSQTTPPSTALGHGYLHNTKGVPAEQTGHSVQCGEHDTTTTIGSNGTHSAAWRTQCGAQPQGCIGREGISEAAPGGWGGCQKRLGAVTVGYKCR